MVFALAPAPITITMSRLAAAARALATSGSSAFTYEPSAMTWAPADTATWIAAACSVVRAVGVVVTTRMGSTVASGATPDSRLPWLACATTMPAMPVPDPRQSVLPRPEPETTSAPTAMCPANWGRLPSAPESTMATSWPLPRLRFQAWLGASRSVAQSDGELALAAAAHLPPRLTGLGGGTGGIAAGLFGGTFDPLFGPPPLFGVDAPPPVELPPGVPRTVRPVGSRPYCTPVPTASHGSTSCQPACSVSPAVVSFPPSGWPRPTLRLRISVDRSAVPRNRWATSESFSGLPLYAAVTV